MDQQFNYGLAARPASIGAVPRLPYRILPSLEDEEGQRLTRHGIIVFERALTPEEIVSFELVVLPDETQVTDLAQQVANDMAEYAAEYLDMAEDDANDFALGIWSRLRDILPYRVHVPDRLRFIELVKERLVAQVHPA